MKNRPSFVFDTNTLVSVILSPDATCKSALDKAENLGQIVFSHETLLEFSTVIARSKFDRYLPLATRLDFVDRFEARFLRIEVVSDFKACRDIKDDKFLHLAIDSNASCIISGDPDLLTMNPFRTIPILSPANFLQHF